MSNQKLKLEQLLKKVSKGLVNDVGTETAEQLPASPAGRLVGRGHFVHSIPSTESRA
jgi:hypothetical protein